LQFQRYFLHFLWLGASNSKAHYDPIANHSTFFQLSLWTILSVTALILSLVTWKATHQLDPRKPLASSIKPLVIQVIALQWKWLFIYPAQHIATVNFIQFPVHTPILFELTADDAPMNSFWIPQLSGQIYAMTGMQTQLHIMTDTPGDFAGSAAEISGAGFASMRFVARASSQANFDTWVFSVKKSQSPLSASAYNTLLAPSENNPVAFYASTEENLYNTILMRYMTPSPTMTMQQMNAIQDMKMK